MVNYSFKKKTEILDLVSDGIRSLREAAVEDIQDKIFTIVQLQLLIEFLMKLKV